jgi:hypothetical protein
MIVSNEVRSGFSFFGSPVLPASSYLLPFHGRDAATAPPRHGAGTAVFRANVRPMAGGKTRKLIAPWERQTCGAGAAGAGSASRRGAVHVSVRFRTRVSGADALPRRVPISGPGFRAPSRLGEPRLPVICQLEAAARGGAAPPLGNGRGGLRAFTTCRAPAESARPAVPGSTRSDPPATPPAGTWRPWAPGGWLPGSRRSGGSTTT